jgi:hypothetical protein
MRWRRDRKHDRHGRMRGTEGRKKERVRDGRMRWRGERNGTMTGTEEREGDRHARIKREKGQKNDRDGQMRVRKNDNEQLGRDLYSCEISS